MNRISVVPVNNCEVATEFPVKAEQKSPIQLNKTESDSFDKASGEKHSITDLALSAGLAVGAGKKTYDAVTGCSDGIIEKAENGITSFFTKLGSDVKIYEKGKTKVKQLDRNFEIVEEDVKKVLSKGIKSVAETGEQISETAKGGKLQNIAEKAKNSNLLKKIKETKNFGTEFKFSETSKTVAKSGAALLLAVAAGLFIFKDSDKDGKNDTLEAIGKFFKPGE